MWKIKITMEDGFVETTYWTDTRLIGESALQQLQEWVDWKFGKLRSQSKHGKPLHAWIGGPMGVGSNKGTDYKWRDNGMVRR